MPPATPALTPPETPAPTPVPTLAPDATPAVGYISLGEDIPFARSVTTSVTDAAAASGVELHVCDSALSPDTAVACAVELGEKGVDGLISFQPHSALAPEICAAVEDVPTIGVAYDQGPCQVARLHIDQAASGRLGGEAMGRFAEEQWDCQLSAYVSLEGAASDVDAGARMDGYREGFEAHCPIPPQSAHALVGADRVATAESQVSRLLEDVKGKRIVVVGVNEDAILGAMRAAADAGRERHLWCSGQGADPSIREHIACDEQYVASVAHFPERYGDLLVPAMLDALQGEPIPEIIPGPMELVDASNVREHYPSTPDCDA
jgi:ribose transport system substrate-binding protein